jgi:hypothetical protein
VKSSPALKWLLVLLLPLTLTWKLAVALRPADPTDGKNAIVEFLAQYQFRAVIENGKGNELFVIAAQSGDCRLFVAEISPIGYSIDQVQLLVTKFDRTFIVFRGTIYSKQPVFLTVVNYLWFSSLRKLGLVSHIPLVLVVISPCDVEQLPWDVLRLI